MFPNICDYEELGLRPASFRGAQFYVTSDTTATGRRIVTHEYPMRDMPYHEDLGKKFTSYKVHGYVYGAAGEELKDSLLGACSARGPALLILPQSVPVSAVCVSVSITRSLEKLGWFSAEMEFKEDAGVTAGPLGLSFFAGLIGSNFWTLAAAVGDSFLTAFSTFTQTVNVVLDAVSMVEDIAAIVISYVEAFPSVDTDEASYCVSEATAMLRDAEAYALPDPDTDQPRTTTIPKIAALVEALSASISYDDGVQVFDALRQFTATAGTIATTRAPSDVQHNTNEDRLVGAFRRLSLVKYAEAVTGRTYTNRADAVQARADLVEAFYNEILTADYSESVVEALVVVRDTAVKALSTTITTLAPVITISSPAAMPALYWSYRVQGDTDQAEAIAERAGAVDWMNIGGEFTVTTRS